MKSPAQKSWNMLLVFTLALVFLTMPAFCVLAQEEEQEQVTGGPEEGEQFTVEGENGAALPEMLVEAQNKVRQDIEKSGFSFELDAAMVDSFYTPMDEEALGVSPVSGLKPHLNNLEVLASDQPPHPWIREIPSTPVATFYPQDPEGHKIKEWSLAITDFRGSPIKTFTGSGEPSNKLSWDGRSDRGEMLKVGYPYSYVFSIKDKGTNTYNHAGVSFRIPALDYRLEGDRILELAGGELFERNEVELKSSGEAWLTRTCDEIRQHPYSPVRVVVVAEDLKLAEQRADVVATYLASSMIVPREQVETDVEQKPNLRAEMDGSVIIYIEHAD